MSKHKLLLADDSITIQKVVNLTFADEGIEVISVGDGNSAVEILSETVPDLVMADVNMPGLNGYQICERIRENDETADIPVILLVGSFEPFDEEEAKRVGANDYLTKPFQSIRQLVEKVTGLLSRKNGEAPVGILTESSAEASPYELGDAGMDDEMIQTADASAYGYDETPKYAAFEGDDDLAKTRPLSTAELRELDLEGEEPAEAYEAEEAEYEADTAEFEALPDEPEAGAEEAVTGDSFEMRETVEESYVEHYYHEEGQFEETIPDSGYEAEAAEAASEPAEAAAEEEYYHADAPSDLEDSGPEEAGEVPLPELDESDLLEIPPSVTDMQGVSGGQLSLSPEVIDAIAEKVAERISADALKEIVREVIPKLTEMISKRLEEERSETGQ